LKLKWIFFAGEIPGEVLAEIFKQAKEKPATQPAYLTGFDGLFHGFKNCGCKNLHPGLMPGIAGSLLRRILGNSIF
jgi:hypothetical protein